ncbi:hypothetical protein MPH_03763 [Macrophomina phaseolina MS6]|uniref:Uncharacterized protein n=1 Tax=Macrophomina phaseolina (strain MS6) TaxID=1126212 RepID=K2S1U1_MACPH|nr:hypothetical protein MPH_03763 [Macrophomina phaseolina MS6]
MSKVSNEKSPSEPEVETSNSWPRVTILHLGILIWTIYCYTHVRLQTQDDTVSRHVRIRAMRSIYANAYCIILAAYRFD